MQRDDGQRSVLATILGVVGVALTGCETKDDRWEAFANLSEPAVVDGAMVLASPTRLGLFVLDADKTVRLVDVGARLEAPRARRGTSEIIALEAEHERLALVDVATGKATWFELGGRFDRVQLTDDGGLAILTRSAGTGGLVNTSEVAFVDLGQAPGPKNPVRRSLPSKGGTVTGVDVSPPFGASGRRIALFRSTSHVAAVAVDEPGDAELRSIPLVSDDAASQVEPASTVFHARPSGLDAFVLTQNGMDVLHLRFADAPSGTPKPTLNQLGVGAFASAALVLPGDPLQVAVAAGAQLVLIAPDTGESTSWPLPYAPSQLSSYQRGAGTELVAWNHERASFIQIALADLATKKGKAITSKRVSTTIASIEAMADGTWLAVLPYTNPYSYAALGLTLVEVDGPGQIPLAGEVDLVVISADREFLFVETEGGRVARIEARTGATRQSEPLGPITALAVLPGSDTLVALRPSTEGSVVFLNAADVEATPHVSENFARLGLFDDEAAQ